ncbi:MAG: OsmC family protein [Bacteroidia bacterium]|nr:OsmC family protein [Bacteroidia bacterium]
MPTAKVTLGNEDFTASATIRNHKVILDEPEASGGKDKGPTAMEMVCAALAACTVTTVKMYLNHKKWATEGVIAEVVQSKDEAGRNIFKRSIQVLGTFDAEQKNRMLAIANKCPVHKALEAGNTIETTLT